MCFDLLQSLLTISFLVDLQVSELILTYLTHQNKLSLIYEAFLRCTTLERWSSPECYPEIRKNHKSDGYEADEEPLDAIKDPYNGLNLFFPEVIPQLLLNFNLWHSKPDFEKDWLGNFSAPFTRMAALSCHSSPASALHEFDLLDLILRDLKSILSSSLRNQLLSMVSLLGHYKILPGHLRSLFLEGYPLPWKDLLPVLLHLIRQDGQMPTHSLPFPGPKGPAEEPEEESLNLSTGSVGSFVQVHDIRWEIHALARNAQELGRLHETKAIGSAWSNAAVFLAILADPNWNMQTDGLAVSLWAFINHTVRSGTMPQWRPNIFDRIVLCGAKESRNVHLFSVGNRSLLIEFWANPVAEKTLLIRVSQSNHSGSQTLASAALNIAIPSGRWNHMVFNCRQKSNGCNTTVNIPLTLNGCVTSSVEIKSPIPSVKRMGNHHSFLLLGTVHGGGRSPVWSLSNSTLFKGELPSVEMAALLTALGHNGGVFLTSCLDGEPLPNFTHYLQPRWIQRLPNLERILDPQSKLMDQLRTKILLTYSAHDPASVFLYPCMISATTGSILPAGYVFNAVSFDPRSCQQPPIALSVATASPLSPQLHSGIRIALKQLGGYSILLFLLDHSVESSADPLSQAGALEILIEWLCSDPQEMRLFSKDAFWMLQHLFQVELCFPGKEFAAVLCCSGLKGGIWIP